MRAIALAGLFILATASAAVALTPRSAVALQSKKCCDDCTVARYRPYGVPVVPATMITGALLLESAIAASGLLAVGLVRRRFPGKAPAAADLSARA